MQIHIILIRVILPIILPVILPVILPACTASGSGEVANSPGFCFKSCFYIYIDIIYTAPHTTNDFGNVIENTDVDELNDIQEEVVFFLSPPSILSPLVDIALCTSTEQH